MWLLIHTMWIHDTSFQNDLIFPLPSPLSLSLSLSLSLLQAGDKHFHPICASCCKCGLSFDEGEDMCIAGDDVWHLDCDKVRAEQGIHSTGNELYYACTHTHTHVYTLYTHTHTSSCTHLCVYHFTIDNGAMYVLPHQFVYTHTHTHTLQILSPVQMVLGHVPGLEVLEPHHPHLVY